MFNTTPIDLGITNEGVKQVNYLAVTKFFQIIDEHIHFSTSPTFQGIIAYGNCNSNKFGNYNVDLGNCIWIMVSDETGAIHPHPIPLEGRVMIQVSKAYCIETPKPNSVVELQIYNQDLQYNAETSYKKYVCTTNISQFVKNYINNIKKSNYETPTKLFTDDNIRY